MKNLIQELPDNINITVTKQDLIEFANYILSLAAFNSVEINSGKKILNVDEAAEFISVSKSYIYKLTMDGLIPHYKRGKRLYFKVEELEEWLTEKRGFNRKEIEAKANEYIIKNPKKW